MVATRAIIGVRTGTSSWRGVYNWLDGYPSALGTRILERARSQTPSELVQSIVDGTPGGWECFADNIVAKQSQYPNGVGPSDVSGIDPQYVYLFDVQAGTLEVYDCNALAKATNHPIGLANFGLYIQIDLSAPPASMSEPPPLWPSLTLKSRWEGSSPRAESEWALKRLRIDETYGADSQERERVRASFAARLRGLGVPELVWVAFGAAKTSLLWEVRLEEFRVRYPTPQGRLFFEPDELTLFALPDKRWTLTAPSDLERLAKVIRDHDVRTWKEKDRHEWICEAFDWIRRADVADPVDHPILWKTLKHVDGRAWNVRVNGVTLEIRIVLPDGEAIDKQRKFADEEKAIAEMNRLLVEQKQDGFTAKYTFYRVSGIDDSSQCDWSNCVIAV
jgi:hypothetical protein